MVYVSLVERSRFASDFNRIQESNSLSGSTWTEVLVYDGLDPVKLAV